MAAPSKAQPKYRITRYSIPWIVALLVLPAYEIFMVVRGYEGGPLTHVVKWIYGDPQSTRWWLIAWPTTGFILWCAPHFLFEGWGVKSLLTLVGLGLLIGAAGAAVTH